MSVRGPTFDQPGRDLTADLLGFAACIDEGIKHDA
jgi:hypothetical protein